MTPIALLAVIGALLFAAGGLATLGYILWQTDRAQRRMDAADDGDDARGVGA